MYNRYSGRKLANIFIEGVKKKTALLDFWKNLTIGHETFILLNSRKKKLIYPG